MPMRSSLMAVSVDLEASGVGNRLISSSWFFKVHTSPPKTVVGALHMGHAIIQVPASLQTRSLRHIAQKLCLQDSSLGSRWISYLLKQTGQSISVRQEFVISTSAEEGFESSEPWLTICCTSEDSGGEEACADGGTSCGSSVVSPASKLISVTVRWSHPKISLVASGGPISSPMSELGTNGPSLPLVVVNPGSQGNCFQMATGCCLSTVV